MTFGNVAGSGSTHRATRWLATLPAKGWEPLVRTVTAEGSVSGTPPPSGAAGEPPAVSTSAVTTLETVAKISRTTSTQLCFRLHSRALRGSWRPGLPDAAWAVAAVSIVVGDRCDQVTDELEEAVPLARRQLPVALTF